MSSQQPNNPLHGVKLVDILTHLVANIGWESMSQTIPIRCFQFDPSIKSSLAFLRKNQWSRDKVEQLYLESLNLNNAPQPYPLEKPKLGKYALRK